MSGMRQIHEAADVDAAILHDAEQIHKDWFSDGRRRYLLQFIYRLNEGYGKHADPPYVVEHYSPAARKIQRHIRTKFPRAALATKEEG